MLSTTTRNTSSRQCYLASGLPIQDLKVSLLTKEVVIHQQVSCIANATSNIFFNGFLGETRQHDDGGYAEHATGEFTCAENDEENHFIDRRVSLCSRLSINGLLYIFTFDCQRGMLGMMSIFNQARFRMPRFGVQKIGCSQM